MAVTRTRRDDDLCIALLVAPLFCSFFFIFFFTCVHTADIAGCQGQADAEPDGRAGTVHNPSATPGDKRGQQTDGGRSGWVFACLPLGVSARPPAPATMKYETTSRARPGDDPRARGDSGAQSTCDAMSGAGGPPRRRRVTGRPEQLAASFSSPRHHQPAMSAEEPWNLYPGHSVPQDLLPRAIPGPTSVQARILAAGQSYLLFPRLRLDSGVVLTNAVVAYKTWGELDPVRRDNALVVTHALTGSADVEDWWGPLLGPGKLFDPTRYFIVCANVLGSPYGSSAPTTRKGGEPSDGPSDTATDGSSWWGPEFPETVVRDDVRIQKALLDYLGVRHVAAVIGGSMGGMAVLEWPLCFPVRFLQPGTERTEAAPAESYIGTIVPIATAASHSAWGISWAEAQRQAIASDPAYHEGYYSPLQPPRAGLAAARMAALLTYRSRESFESRFGRRTGSTKSSPTSAAAGGQQQDSDGPLRTGEAANEPPPKSVFNAQSYLRYQGDKFVKRFDANCYMHLSQKMDSHDVARGRRTWGQRSAGEEKEWAGFLLTPEGRFSQVGAAHADAEPFGSDDEHGSSARGVLGVLSTSGKRFGAPSPAVHVVSIESDGLFAPPEQGFIAQSIQGSQFDSVRSTDGHDGFLLEFEQMDAFIQAFLRSHLKHIYEPAKGPGWDNWHDWPRTSIEEGGPNHKVKESTFGEVEDPTRW